MSKSSGKTKTQLIAELEILNQRVAELEASKPEQIQPDGALRESDLRYQHIIQTLTDYIYTVRIEDGRAVETVHGPACVAVTGYASEDFAAHPNLWLQMVDEEDRTAVLEQTRQIMNGQDAEAVEHRITRKDGVMRWVRNKPAPHFDLEGNLVSYDGLIQDITDRKRAEEELKEREVRYRTIVENINDALYIHDLEGTIQDVNESACRMLGYGREELIGVHLSKIDSLDNAQQVQQRMNELIQNGLLVFDGEHLAKSGKRIPVQVSAKLVSLEGKGTIQGFVRDISEHKQAEEALRASEAKMHSIFRAAPVGIGLVVDRVIVEANDHLCEMTGYTREELLGQNARIVYATEEDFAYVGWEKYRQISEHGTGSVETRWRRKDGPIMQVLLNSTPLNPDNLSVGVTFTALDITERKRMEEALLESQAKYRTLVESAAMGVGMLVENRFILANPALLQIFGYSTLDEFAKVPLLEHVVSSSRNYVAGVMKKRANSNQEPVEFEYDIRRKDGEIRALRASMAPIVVGGKLCSLTTYQDITERKQAEEALRTSEALYHDLVETSQDLIWRCDATGRYTFLNQAWETTLGYKLDEMLGNQFSDFQSPEYAERDRREFERLLQGDAVKGFETVHIGKDGRQIHLVFNAKFMTDEKGTVVGTSGTAYDITERKQAQEALAQERNLLRTLVDSLPDHIYAKDIEGRFTLKNEADARFMGAGSPNEAIGKTDFDYYPREYAERFRLDDEQVMFGEVPSINCEAQNVDGQGNKHWILATKMPLRDSQGKVIGLVGVGRDITDRKRAEEALRASEEKYRLLFKTNPVPMWVYDIDTLAFLAVNDFAVDHYGYSQEEFLSMTIKDVRSPEDVPYLYEVLNKHTGQLRKVGVTKHRRRDGSLIDVEITGHEIEFEGRRAMLVLAMDITERKRAENLIRAQRDLALALGATSNLEKGLRLCLNTALLLSGMDGGGVYRVDEVSGEIDLAAHQGTSSRFIARTSHYEADSPNAQLVMAGKPIYTEHTQLGIPLDEIERRENLRGVAVIPIHHEDQVIGCLNVASYSMTEVPSFARDALEMIAAQMGDVIVHMKAEAELQQYRGHLEELVDRRTAELKAANDQLLVLTRAKDEFVSNVSHELRTPISSLKLRQHLLECHPDQLDDHLHAIKRETERLARTIEDLLQLSRLDQRRMEFQPVSIDLNELAEQYVTDRLPVARDGGVTLSFHGEPGTPKVTADAGLVGQALSILLTNAINYTPAGGRVLVCTHSCQDAGIRWAGFSISDTGPGISLEERPQLFERFFRGRVGRKSGVPGTGLGLPIAQEIINRHGGSIEVESDGIAGHGATFRVWIPVAEKTNEQSASCG